MTRRHLKPALAACSYAVFGGRSPAQAGSRCKDEHREGGLAYCRQDQTA